jgi:hypothetical protein
MQGDANPRLTDRTERSEEPPRELSEMQFSTRASIATNEGVRRCPRTLFSVPIRLHHLIPGGISTTRGITLDISEGGLGALVQGDLRLGETVEIDLQLPGNSLSTVAIVRHTSNVRSGFEFLGITPEERLQIAKTCGRHLLNQAGSVNDF